MSLYFIESFWRFFTKSTKWLRYARWFIINWWNVYQKIKPSWSSNFQVYWLCKLWEYMGRHHHKSTRFCVNRSWFYLKCDGTSINISTLTNLGFEFTDDFKLMKTSFRHPARNYHVYGTLEACHSLKVNRNALGDLKFFKSPNSLYWMVIYV